MPARISRIAVFVAIASLIGTASAADPLAVAKELAASRFDGWRYGSNAAKQEVDCVQFLLAVVEESIQATLALEARNRLLVAELSEEEKKHPALGILVIDGDARTKGVQSALIDAGLGEAVPIAEASSGDLIQYWMKKNDGTWFGHAGVIESVDRSGGLAKARIFGAHATPSPGKIGTSTFELRLFDDTDRRIYLVRLK
jgi:hypothetical protein